MPRVYRTKPEIERILVREFLKEEGYAISSATWPDRPDAVLTSRQDRTRKRTAIELTQYFNDTEAGTCSALTPIGEFWKLVNSSLVKRISHRKHLGGILGTVSFRANPPLPMGKKAVPKVKARQLAKEIVEFTEGHPFSKVEGSQFFRRADFLVNTEMHHLLDSLRLGRRSDASVPPSICSWSCFNITTKHISVSLQYIKAAIQQKNKKAASYDWRDATEKWLLIVAGGGDVSTSAPRYPADVKWDDPDLKKLCVESRFDRIVLWNRVYKWRRWLK